MVEAVSADERVRMSRRLRPFYFAVAMQSFVLWYAIEKPFLDGIGLSTTQITTLAVILNVVLVTVNIPMGMLADKWSRKGSLMIGGAGLAVCDIAAFLSHGFGVYVIATISFGIFVASFTGGYDSVIYDVVLEETGSGDAYPTFCGRLRMIEGIALGASSLLGGLLAWLLEPRAAFAFTLPFSIGSLLALWKFREPRHHKLVEHVDKARLLQTLRVLGARVHTLTIMLTTIASGTIFLLITQLDQLWLLALDVPIVAYGPINALLLVSLALGGYLAGRPGRGSNSDAAYALVGIFATVGLLIPNVIIVVASQAALCAIITLLNVALGKRLHDVTTSSVRSSVASVISTIGMGVFVPITLAVGYVTESYSVFRSSWIFIGIAVAAFVGLMIIGRTAASPATLPAVDDDGHPKVAS